MQNYAFGTLLKTAEWLVFTILFLGLSASCARAGYDDPSEHSDAGDGGQTDGDDGGQTDGDDGVGDDVDPVGWDTKIDMPFASGGLASAILSDGIHVLGGCNNYNCSNLYKLHYVYHVESETWSPSPADMPDEDTWGVQAQVYSNKLYLAGGWPNGDYSFRVYDSNTNLWQNLPNIPAPYSYGFVSAVVGEYFYIIGGRDGGDTNAPVYKYDLVAGSWSACASIPENRGSGSLSGAAWGAKIYVLNGDIAGGSTILQIYDTATDSWSSGAGLGAHYEAAAAVAVTGKVYFFGGILEAFSGTPPVHDTVNIYDTQTDSWSIGTAMPTARWHATVQYVNQGFHVFGGFDSDNIATAAHEVFSP